MVKSSSFFIFHFAIVVRVSSCDFVDRALGLRKKTLHEITRSNAKQICKMANEK